MAHGHLIGQTITIPKFVQFIESINSLSDVLSFEQILIPMGYDLDERPAGPMGRAGPGGIYGETIPCDSDYFALQITGKLDKEFKVDDIVSKLKLSPPGRYRQGQSGGGFYTPIDINPIIKDVVAEKREGYYKTRLYDVVAQAKLSIHPEYTWKDIVGFRGKRSFDTDLVTLEPYHGESELLYEYTYNVQKRVPSGEYRMVILMFHRDIDDNAEVIGEMLEHLYLPMIKGIRE